ncbi:cell division protein ZapA [Candidatus Poribacteria bacterium]|nr:cell division protein ZapA [Candidatus Poribacteria bacterium]
MDSQDDFESLSLHIFGPPVRVRVPASEAKDIERAAEMLRNRFEEARDPREPPDRTLLRVALEVAYESYCSQRNAGQMLRRLLKMLDHEMDA